MEYFGNTWSKQSDAHILEMAEKSDSVADLLRRLGVYKTSNRVYINRRLRRLGILDTLLEKAKQGVKQHLQRLSRAQKLPFEQVFIKDSPSQSNGQELKKKIDRFEHFGG